MAESAAPQRAQTRPSIERLLNPKSLAIAGISSTPGSLAGIVLDNLRRFGFSGEVHLVHPKQDEIQGLRCVRSVRGLPHGIDCVVLALPAAGVLDAVKACATRGVAMVAEHFRDPQRFLALARQARERGIVIVLLHPGRSAAARQSAQTHTGALAGDYDVMRTLVERQDVIVVDTLEELIDLADCSKRSKTRPNSGDAMLGESGAYKALTLDYCESIGIDLQQ